MNKNSEAIVIFCSHLCVDADIKPLEPREWAELALRLFSKGLEPNDLLLFNKSDFLEKLVVDEMMANRYLRLLERSGSISFEISKYENMGIDFPFSHIPEPSGAQMAALEQTLQEN